ncbi:MAG: quinolinate synthase NadA, partial [Symploca sp. SIO2G7]|nr:quinolinate synthase NadA [Symploca sp. SIO2G7]
RSGANVVGSTTALLKYVENSKVDQFIVVTEPGIIHQMEKQLSNKLFIPAPPDANCQCNECPHMRLNTLEKLYLAMKNRTPEITLPEKTQQKALVPIERMLAMSA